MLFSDCCVYQNSKKHNHLPLTTKLAAGGLSAAGLMTSMPPRLILRLAAGRREGSVALGEPMERLAEPSFLHVPCTVLGIEICRLHSHNYAVCKDIST